MASFPWEVFFVSMLIVTVTFYVTVVGLVAIIFGNWKVVNSALEGLKEALKNLVFWHR